MCCLFRYFGTLFSNGKNETKQSDRGHEAHEACCNGRLMNKDVVLLGDSFSDVYNNLFKDDFSNFEAFLMLAIHRRSDSNTNSA